MRIDSCEAIFFHAEKIRNLFQFTLVIPTLQRGNDQLINGEYAFAHRVSRLKLTVCIGGLFQRENLADMQA